MMLQLLHRDSWMCPSWLCGIDTTLELAYMITKNLDQQIERETFELIPSFSK
jgi:hypothetical protein